MTQNNGIAEGYRQRRVYVLANWETLSDEEMADFLEIAVAAVIGVRKRLNLHRAYRPIGGSGEASQRRAEMTIAGPRGYTPEQIAWARKHAGPFKPGATGIDQEAGMMLVMHSDRAGLVSQ